MGSKDSSFCKLDVISRRQDISASDEFAASFEAEQSVIEEARVCFEQKLQFTDWSKHLFMDDLNSNQNQMPNTNNGNTCQESKIVDANDLIIDTKRLEKSLTFSCSEESVSSSVSMDGMENKLVVMKQSKCHLKDTNSASAKAGGTAYERSLSLPPSVKLVSAMKGARQLQGHPSKGKLNVKWAPDVYDPPITLMSHTVKNHHQRSKPKKKERNKHKHKSRSSRGSAGAKKHVIRTTNSNNPEPLFLRLQAPMDKLLLDGLPESGVEDILDYAVNGADAKCGSSFLVGSLSKVQFPTAEA